MNLKLLRKHRGRPDERHYIKVSKGRVVVIKPQTVANERDSRMWFISLVFKNVWRRKVRSVVTCTSMAIAVCAVLSMLGTAEGYEQPFADLYQARCVPPAASHFFS